MRWMAVLVLALIACEGSEGPTGPEGEQGPAGEVEASRVVYAGVADSRIYVPVEEDFSFTTPPIFACYKYEDGLLAPTEYCAVRPHPVSGELSYYADGPYGEWEYRIVVMH